MYVHGPNIFVINSIFVFFIFRCNEGIPITVHFIVFLMFYIYNTVKEELFKRERYILTNIWFIHSYCIWEYLKTVTVYDPGGLTVLFFL